MTTVDAVFGALKHGTARIIPEDEFHKKLLAGKKLRIKLGLDPTAPDLHLGHTVVLSKLRQFQDLGHEIIFLIGDFTARIGDPTGRSKTRPPLTTTEIEQNMKTYLKQVGKVLDISKISIRYNSEWLAKLSMTDFVSLASKVTVARLIEREDFKNRIEQGQPIGFHELLYPLFQGYDSVALDADVELGGTDQTFNLLMGRSLQEQFDRQPQVVMTVPLLEGLDGVQKMSKSLGNAISLAEPAYDAFGKLMSISDTLMWRYLVLLLGVPDTELLDMKERVVSGKVHPMDLKKDMARRIVAKFWTEKEATKALSDFESVFQRGDYAAGAHEISLSPSASNPLWIVDLLREIGAIKSSSEAKRLIENGALTIDTMPVTDFKASVTWKQGMIIRVGKHRIYKLR